MLIEVWNYVVWLSPSLSLSDKAERLAALQTTEASMTHKWKIAMVRACIYIKAAGATNQNEIHLNILIYAQRS